MSGIFDQFREKVFHSVWKGKGKEPQAVAVDDKIALGVLLWEVAQADNKFLPEEKQKIKEKRRKWQNLDKEQKKEIRRRMKEEYQRMDQFGSKGSPGSGSNGGGRQRGRRR